MSAVVSSLCLVLYLPHDNCYIFIVPAGVTSFYMLSYAHLARHCIIIMSAVVSVLCPLLYLSHDNNNIVMPSGVSFFSCNRISIRPAIVS